jgi:hypothetical protein
VEFLVGVVGNSLEGGKGVAFSVRAVRSGL